MQSTRTGLNSFSYNYFAIPSTLKVFSYFTIVAPIFLALMLGITEAVSCCFKARKMNQKEMSEFFRSVTPQNIKSLFNFEPSKNDELNKSAYHLLLGNPIILKKPGEGNFFLADLDIKDNKFVVAVGTTSEDKEFDNLEDVFKFWMKGDFPGGESTQVPYFLIETSKGEILRYNNPHQIEKIERAVFNSIPTKGLDF